MEASSFDEVDLCRFHGFGSVLGGEGFARDYTGVVALKKPCNLGTSILMSEPAGMEAGSLDGDSGACR